MPDREKVLKYLKCGANGALNCFDHDCPYYDIGCSCDVAQIMLDAVTLIESQKPNTGKWYRTGEPPMYVIKCSICGQRYFNHVMQPLANYCSMCGAKMESVLCDGVSEGKDNADCGMVTNFRLLGDL